MAAKRKRHRAQSTAAARAIAAVESQGGGRKRRTDEEKVGIVRQVMTSGNQSAEIKKLGIYPNQFYDWKKRFASQLGAVAKGVARRGRVASALGGSVLDEAKSFVQSRGALLERLRAQRTEIEQLIRQLES